jgi:hypothetical protein
MANSNFFVSASRTDQSFVAGCVKLGMDSTFTVNLRLTLELRALCFALEIKFELAGNEAI